jgi:hypothetical protein
MFSFASAPPSAPSTFGGPDPTVPGNPRYQNFYAPAGTSAQTSRGEFNIGFDPITHRIMVMNLGPIWRLTPGEVQSPAKPECCEALWEDKSSISTDLPLEDGLDPILWTDQKTGRTFASNSTAGANAVYGYTAAAAPFNDGDQWVPVAISPPNGGVDHQTIGSGPYPALLSALSTPVNQGEYVLYCSQDAVGSMCQRSDDLGASYGPGVIAMGPGTMNSQGCGGLHGHVHIAPDGTAWMGDDSCGGGQGGAFSLDASTTPWTEFSVPDAVTAGRDNSDPSIGLDANSTVYYCYGNGEDDGIHAHVAVGKRTGSSISWLRDTDVGISHGIVNAAFFEAVGGDAGRASCGFLGTNVSGSFQGTSFAGDWYVFIATTYDEGVTWVTVNATPNDPVQHRAGICLDGTGCGSGTAPRNLLDFNEITMDDKGRVLYGYSDGCVTAGCIAGTSSNNNTGYMRVARQFGGKPLFSAFDPVEPAVPKAPCLSGTRNSSGVHLTWKAPDNGGADITQYAIYRGTASGTETLLLVTGNTKISYDDITADPSQPVYYYVRAINSVDLAGGALSNEVNFPATPGIQLISVNSVKTHGSAGTFGVNLPLDGSGIECRTAGGLPGGASGDYELVFHFANPVSNVTDASFAGTGSITSTSIQSGDYVVVLSGVTNVQRVAVTLTGVTDSAGHTAASVSTTMGVLIGDVNATKRTDSGDVTQVRNRTVSVPDATTFRFDVNASGRIDAGDVTTTRNATVTVLP